MVELLTHELVTVALSIMAFINICLMARAELIITRKDFIKGAIVLVFGLVIICVLSHYGTTVVRAILNVLLATIVILSGGKS